MRVRIIFFFLIIGAVLIINVPSARGCTVWGATGQKVNIKGTIIAKNRDNSPNLSTHPRLLFPLNGFNVFGLYDAEVDGYIVGGINEKGLAVLNASVTSVPREKRHVATEDTTERILTTFDSVNAVLSRRDIFIKSHPALYMVADSSRVAMIEVAPGGKIAIKDIENGILAFANHYTDANLTQANEHRSVNSEARLKRIQNYLTSSEKPFTMNDFIMISEDRAGGSDYALWRTGSTSGKVRTLASFIVSIPVSGLPEIYMKISNPDEPDSIFTGKLDFSLFSVSGSE
ncbi:MAG: carcinine hydrolase/isopenicillin-N N-acyltransferase family protein [Proteobacteria bacterium]|nr:carcinine hydrolase/isopenicillin-N N-acyltransferase family protein [Pseudomonadota bacterium]